MIEGEQEYMQEYITLTFQRADNGWMIDISAPDFERGVNTCRILVAKSGSEAQSIATAEFRAELDRVLTAMTAGDAPA